MEEITCKHATEMVLLLLNMSEPLGKGQMAMRVEMFREEGGR